MPLSFPQSTPSREGQVKKGVLVKIWIISVPVNLEIYQIQFFIPQMYNWNWHA